MSDLIDIDFDPFHDGPEAKAINLRYRLLQDLDDVFEEFYEMVLSRLLDHADIGNELTNLMYASLHEKIRSRDWTLADVTLDTVREEWRKVKEWFRFMNQFSRHPPIRVYPDQIPRLEWKTYLEMRKKEKLIMF
ncbi:hypothetical protein QAD02_007497 [Eretmocerus hayati]|uniref:Uncharacterized protein n=1 Tax=Eretmocerus hayati TaxID=131215 RepID=A0ACC2N861_9HYME|nr:hypothetical protein QAD02_007497 [Eretmocerus hayati]